MKERPILFNTEMVKAVLEGRKTVTRRPVKGLALEWLAPGMFSPWYTALPENDMSPYGKIGDRLYVRETWCKLTMGFAYKVDDSIFETSPIFKWKPSIHMPKEAARIWLEITDIRVERVQDITSQQCIKEGFQSDFKDSGISGGHVLTQFHKVWDSIYGKDNIWVWVVEFKRVEK